MGLLGLSTAGYWGEVGEEITINNFTLPLDGEIKINSLDGDIKVNKLDGDIRCQK
jgi:hypothetical protein